MVKKIFTVLITAVACILIGAFILNAVVPNATSAIADAIDNTVFMATGIQMDINGNGTSGSASADVSGSSTDDGTAQNGTGGGTVDGWQ